MCTEGASENTERKELAIRDRLPVEDEYLTDSEGHGPAAHRKTS